MNDQLQSQNVAILERLLRGPLTPLEALEDPNIRSFRLGARIYELKREGWPIVTEMVKVGTKRVARYTLMPRHTEVGYEFGGVGFYEKPVWNLAPIKRQGYPEQQWDDDKGKFVWPKAMGSKK